LFQLLAENLNMTRIIAVQLKNPPREGFLPDPSAWEKALPIAFCSNWRGERPDPMRETQVRLLWSNEYLFIRFHCRYRTMYVYEDKLGRRDKLWLKDVAEVFIQPSAHDPRHYREFEISPNGDWLDLDIDHGKRSILYWDLTTRVSIDPGSSVWTAELALQLGKMVRAFDPNEIWRLNLFRIEGWGPDRFYSSWLPTHTPRPNFHVPECFGTLQFVKGI
jgi:alpha-galactosidase